MAQAGGGGDGAAPMARVEVEGAGGAAGPEVEELRQSGFHQVTGHGGHPGLRQLSETAADGSSLVAELLQLSIYDGFPPFKTQSILFNVYITIMSRSMRQFCHQSESCAINGSRVIAVSK